MAQWPQCDAVFGASPVTAALAARRRTVHKLFVERGGGGGGRATRAQRRRIERQQCAVTLAEAIGVSVDRCSRAFLSELIASATRRDRQRRGDIDSARHQGLVLLAEPAMTPSLQTLPAAAVADGASPPLWLALDELQDPQNLGSILRTACFLGLGTDTAGISDTAPDDAVVVQGDAECGAQWAASSRGVASIGSRGVVISARNSAALTSAVSRASAGASEMCVVHATQRLDLLLEEARSQPTPWRVVGAAAAPPPPLRRGANAATQAIMRASDLKLDCPTVLVLGNEAHGLRTNIVKQCDALVSIGPRQLAGHAPERGTAGVGHALVEEHIDSLNVSAAAAILLHNLLGA